MLAALRRREQAPTVTAAKAEPKTNIALAHERKAIWPKIAKIAALGTTYGAAGTIGVAAVLMPHTTTGDYLRGWGVIFAVAVAATAWWCSQPDTRFRAFAFVIGAVALWLVQAAITSPDLSWQGPNRFAQIMGAISLAGVALAIWLWSAGKGAKTVLWLVWFWSVGCSTFLVFAPRELAISYGTQLESIEFGFAVWFMILLPLGLLSELFFGPGDNWNAGESPGVARSQWADLSGRDFAAVDLDQE